MVKDVNRLIIILLIGFVFACSNQKKIKPSLYISSSKELTMDDKINKMKVDLDSFELISNKLTNKQLKLLNEIVTNTNLHEKSNLGTCEITYLFVLKDKLIYTTCGTAQIVVCDNKIQHSILLKNKGMDKLDNLISEIEANK